MKKNFKVKGYNQIRKAAPKTYKVNGKVNIHAKKVSNSLFQLVGFKFFKRREENVEHPTRNLGLRGFIGPSLQQRLLGFAIASTLVTVSIENFTFSGRVINVDINAFEITVIDQLNSPFQRGAIVTVSFAQLNAISVGGC